MLGLVLDLVSLYHRGDRSHNSQGNDRKKLYTAVSGCISHACLLIFDLHVFFKHFFLFIMNSTFTFSVHANFSTSQHSTFCIASSHQCWKQSPEILIHIELLEICWLHIHVMNFSFHHIPKEHNWTEIWWLGRPFEALKTIIIVMVKKQDLCDIAHCPV